MNAVLAALALALLAWIALNAATTPAASTTDALRQRLASVETRRDAAREETLRAKAKLERWTTISDGATAIEPQPLGLTPAHDPRPNPARSALGKIFGPPEGRRLLRQQFEAGIQTACALPAAAAGLTESARTNLVGVLVDRQIATLDAIFDPELANDPARLGDTLRDLIAQSRAQLQAIIPPGQFDAFSQSFEEAQAREHVAQWTAGLPRTLALDESQSTQLHAAWTDAEFLTEGLIPSETDTIRDISWFRDSAAWADEQRARSASLIERTALFLRPEQQDSLRSHLDLQIAFIKSSAGLFLDD